MPADPERRPGLTDWERRCRGHRPRRVGAARSASTLATPGGAGSGGPPRAEPAPRRPPAAAAGEHQHTGCDKSRAGTARRVDRRRRGGRRLTKPARTSAPRREDIARLALDGGNGGGKPTAASCSGP